MSNDVTPRQTHDERLNEAQREQSDQAAAALKRRPGNQSEGLGAGAGAVLTPMIILGSIFMFMFYACFNPVSALAGILGGLIAWMTFTTLVPGVGFMMNFLVALPFAFASLMMFAQREFRLEGFKGYILARHAMRLLFTAIIVGFTVDFVTSIDTVREPGGIDKVQAAAALDKPYAWIHFAIVIAAVVAVHFVGMWYDRNNAQTAGGVGGLLTRADAPSRWRIPGSEYIPASLRGGLPAMTLAGGAFGAFLGYAAFETSVSTLVGLFAGCVGGALLMFTTWLITRPVGSLFDRAPFLWPLLMGAIVGVGVAWRLALADKVSIATYLLPGVIGGAVVLAAPYLLFAIGRKFVGRRT